MQLSSGKQQACVEECAAVLPTSVMAMTAPGFSTGALELLARRKVELAKEIGSVKRGEGLPIKDAEREGEILDRLTNKTRLDKDFVRGLYESIIEYCRENE